MADIKTVLRSFAAGAAAMYFFDPRLGRRRRAMTRDAVKGQWNDLSDQLDKARRDVVNRSQGVSAAAKAMVRREHVDDSLLIDRVRSAIGRAVSHPHAIAARADHGRIVLQGPVLAAEAERLVRCVKRVRGVREVVNLLEVHETAENVPGLQGGVPRESRSELMQQNWTPALRVGAGGIAGALIYYGLRRDGVLKAAGLVGSAVLARAVLNKEFRQIVGAGGGARAVEVDKAIIVFAPIGEVFSFWANYQNFPRFMTHLKEVHDLGNGRSRWVAEGPAGTSISWDAELVDFVANKLIAWRSVPGSKLQTEGVVRFDEQADGSTRVGIRLFYSPPAGVLGHLVASLFGADPKHEINDDMVRFKSLIEDGKTRAHGHTVTRVELSGPPEALHA